MLANKQLNWKYVKISAIAPLVLGMSYPSRVHV